MTNINRYTRDISQFVRRKRPGVLTRKTSTLRTPQRQGLRSPILTRLTTSRSMYSAENLNRVRLTGGSLGDSFLTRRAGGRTSTAATYGFPQRGIRTGTIPATSILTRDAGSYGIPAGVVKTAGDTGGVTGGGLDLNLGFLGDIGTNIESFFGDTIERGKDLIPVALKIVAAVIIVKIVLWLVRGRRR